MRRHQIRPRDGLRAGDDRAPLAEPRVDVAEERPVERLEVGRAAAQRPQCRRRVAAAVAVQRVERPLHEDRPRGAVGVRLAVGLVGSAVEGDGDRVPGVALAHPHVVDALAGGVVAGVGDVLAEVHARLGHRHQGGVEVAGVRPAALAHVRGQVAGRPGDVIGDVVLRAAPGREVGRAAALRLVAVHEVDAGAAVDEVLSAAAHQPVPAGVAAVNHVVGLAAEHQVVARAAVDDRRHRMHRPQVDDVVAQAVDHDLLDGPRAVPRRVALDHEQAVLLAHPDRAAPVGRANGEDAVGEAGGAVHDHAVFQLLHVRAG